MIEIMDTISIDDNRDLIVANKTVYNNKEYYLLVNEEDPSDVLIGYIDNNELVSIEDKNEFNKILGLFDINELLKVLPKDLLNQDKEN